MKLNNKTHFILIFLVYKLDWPAAPLPCRATIIITAYPTDLWEHVSQITESLKQVLEITTLIFAGSFCSHLYLHVWTPPFASPILQPIPPLMLLIKPFQQHQKQKRPLSLFSSPHPKPELFAWFFEPNKILTGDGLRIWGSDQSDCVAWAASWL